MEYENIKTGEIVIEEDAKVYVKEKLGITIQPVRRKWRIYNRTDRSDKCTCGMVFLWRLDRERSKE